MNIALYAQFIAHLRKYGCMSTRKIISKRSIADNLMCYATFFSPQMNVSTLNRTNKNILLSGLAGLIL